MAYLTGKPEQPKDAEKDTDATREEEKETINYNVYRLENLR